MGADAVDVPKKVADDIMTEKRVEEAPKPATPQEAHPGCVERKLTPMDRRLCVEAVEAYWRKEAKGEKKRDTDLKAMARIKKVRDALNMEGVAEYFDSTTDAYAEKVEKWGEAVRAYNEALQANKDPLPEKPNRRRPKQSDEELRGPEATYWLKTPVDAHVQECIKEMDWKGFSSEDVCILRDKFGIKVELEGDW